VTVNGSTATGPVFTYQVALVVTSVAGANLTFGSADGKGAAASFNQPNGLTTDAAGNVYVADEGNNLIRKITPDGTVSTLAGSGQSGHADGTGSAASFGKPAGVAVDASGNIYVADSFNYLIRKVTPSGVVSTIAGNSSNQPANGQGTAASFSRPLDVAVDGSGNIFVADQGAGQIRKITSSGLVTTVYGGNSLDPYQLAVDKSGNIYAADGTGNNIKKITQSGVMTIFAGNNNIIGGDIDGTGTGAAFYMPLGLTIDGNGNLFVVDSGNGLIREITPAAVVTTIGGRSPVNQYGPVTQAVLSGVQGIAVDANGSIYFTYGNEIRKISMQ
jgi:sugar lactone lactonase YvrE